MLCRFATNDYQCDVEVGNPHPLTGDVYISIAQKRIEFKSQIPEKVQPTDKEKFIERINTIKKLASEADIVDIDHEMAGQNAILPLEQSVSVLIGLMADGIRVPIHVIDELLCCQVDMQKAVDEEPQIITLN